MNFEILWGTMEQRAADGVDTERERERLSRERIVTCAMAIADAEGIEALSMRRVASELGATPMALYNHVAGKDELLNEIAGELLKEIDTSGIDPSDWAGSIKTGYTEFRRVLLRHPNLLPVMQRKTEMSVEAMRPIELAVALFRSAGFSAEDAMHAHWTLSGYTMGHVLWQMTTPLLEEEDEESGGFTSQMKAHGLRLRALLPPAEFPCLLASLPSLEEYDEDAAWEFGIDSIIEGFKSKLASRAG